MSTPDEAFLAEVDNFLNSCDTAVFSVMRALNEDESCVATLPPQQVTEKEELQVTKTDAKTRENLRHQVDELSLQLERMQKAKEVDCVISTMAWKTVSIQQFEARQAAEQEQQILQAAVQSQGKLIHDCSHFVQETLEGRQLDDAVPHQHKRIRLEPSDTDIYEGYVRELDTIYAQTDEIFQKNPVDTTSGCRNSTWKVNTRTGYFEFVDRKSIALDFQQASHILWQLGLLLHHEEDRELYEGVGDSENTIVLKLRISTRLPTDRFASALQRIVGRRYQENARVVVVWRSFTEGEGCFRGMHSDETGWCVIKRSSDERAVLDIFIRNIPMHFSTAEKDRNAVEQFTHLVCNSGSEDIFEMTDSLDKMSLNDP